MMASHRVAFHLAVLKRERSLSLIALIVPSNPATPNISTSTVLKRAFPIVNIFPDINTFYS
jgi:hypothetical protein